MPIFNFKKGNVEMKKIVFVALLSGVFLGSALADDLLAKASNGTLSENSPGVKKLSQAEMAEVVGGYKIGSVNWYGYYTPTAKPFKNNYNANKYPKTNKQSIYSNGWCKYNYCLSGRY